jgi:hypothetical protein
MKLADFLKDISNIFDDFDSCLDSAVEATREALETNGELASTSSETIDKETGETVGLGDMFGVSNEIF